MPLDPVKSLAGQHTRPRLGLYSRQVKVVTRPQAYTLLCYVLAVRHVVVTAIARHGENPHRRYMKVPISGQEVYLLNLRHVLTTGYVEENTAGDTVQENKVWRPSSARPHGVIGCFGHGISVQSPYGPFGAGI